MNDPPIQWPGELTGLRWIQADVLSRAPLAGNGLAAFGRL